MMDTRKLNVKFCKKQYKKKKEKKNDLWPFSIILHNPHVGIIPTCRSAKHDLARFEL